MEKFNKILVDNGERLKIMKLLKCTYPTVRTALKGGDIKTPLALKIRKLAIENGGVELKDEE